MLGGFFTRQAVALERRQTHSGLKAFSSCPVERHLRLPFGPDQVSGRAGPAWELGLDAFQSLDLSLPRFAAHGLRRLVVVMATTAPPRNCRLRVGVSERAHFLGGVEPPKPFVSDLNPASSRFGA